MPQRGERAHGYLWHQAGGFYCYVLFEIVGVLLLLWKWENGKNTAIKSPRSAIIVRDTQLLWHQAGGFYCYVWFEIVGVLLLSLLFWIVCVWTNQKNSGWTSVDRSTKATLSTYNTWIHVSRLQKIYHFQSLKLWLTTKPLTAEAADMQQGRDLMLDM